MATPTLKEMLHDVYKSVDAGNLKFEFILESYIRYIFSLRENKDYLELAKGDGVNFIEKYTEILNSNLSGKGNPNLLRETMTNLWGVSKAANGDFKKVIRLVITGLASKKSMLDYSHYPEYLSEDLLALVVSVLNDLSWIFAKDFCIYLEKNAKEKKDIFSIYNEIE